MCPHWPCNFTDVMNKGDRFRINVIDGLTDATMLRSTSIVSFISVNTGLLFLWLFYSSIGTVSSRMEPMRWMEVFSHLGFSSLRPLLTQAGRCICKPVPNRSKPFVSIQLHRPRSSGNILVSFSSFNPILWWSERATGHLWPIRPTCSVVWCWRWFVFFLLHDWTN
jgi:hypothetical protein